MKTLFMLSVTSDIGVSIAKKFSELGYRIVGTYRDKVAACKIIEENKILIYFGVIFLASLILKTCDQN